MSKLWQAGRIFFGAYFIYAGAEYFLPWFVQPLGQQPAAHDFTAALIASGVFAWVKAMELIVGVLVLANRWAVLALLANLPISAMVFYWNYWLEGGAIAYIFGAICLGLNLALLWPFRHLLEPLLAMQPARKISNTSRA